MESIGDPREGPSTERAFEAEPLSTWTEQITVRSVVVSLVLGTLLCVINMKLSLTSGMMPSLNVSAGLLGLFLLKTWTGLLARCGVFHRPFTRQENAIVQTCVVACVGITFSGGFGTYILGMSAKAAEAPGIVTDKMNNMDPSLGRLIAFLFLTNFVGLFALLPMRKTMIIRHRLTYPSGTATAHLINSFHTPQGAKQAKKQVSLLLKSFGGSMFWSFFQWFFAAQRGCGFSAFPTFGLEAYNRGFNFDFSATFVGIGMICPYLINISMLVGSVVSWGIMWPYIRTKKGIWYSADIPETSLRSVNGYKVFICIGMVLGDGLFNFLVIFGRTIYTMYNNKRPPAGVAPKPFSNVNAGAQQHPALSFDDRRRTQIFLKEKIPSSLALAGYILLAAVSIVAIPHLYPQVKYCHVVVAYVFAPLLAFCNAYGTGITDFNLSNHYSKVVILLFALWIGVKDGGVVGGLVICGVMMSIVSTAADFMQDFKTGYLTLTSPRALFLSQVIGMGLGCVINPVVFWVFYSVYKVGSDQTETNQVPFAKLYRGIAILGANGLTGVPKYSLELCEAFFALAVAVSALREVAMRKNWRVQRYIPSIVGLAVSFFVPPSMPIDMCVASLVLFMWRRADMEGAQLFAPVVASGLICGDGLFSLPASLLSMYNVQPPLCIKFLSRATNTQVDGFLSKLASPNS